MAGRFLLHLKQIQMLLTQIKMLHPLLTLSQSVSLIQIFDTNSHTDRQTVQIQISWLLKKPTDLDLHCVQRLVVYGFSRAWGLSIPSVNFNPFPASCNFYRLLITFANSLDPDQTQQTFWHSADIPETFFWKSSLKQNPQRTKKVCKITQHAKS